MKTELQRVLPNEIEKRSMEIIRQELGERVLPKENAAVIQRVIHTTADFDYVEHLCFTPRVVENTVALLKQGSFTIITDTKMASVGINAAAVEKLGGRVLCFMQDADVAAAAKKNGTTRAAACMDKAAEVSGTVFFAIGNAPTALVRICELIDEKKIRPALVAGVPVGFVNVVESKEMLLDRDVPSIVARGRKGGSNVAAAILNALLYQAIEREL